MTMTRGRLTEKDLKDQEYCIFKGRDCLMRANRNTTAQKGALATEAVAWFLAADWAGTCNCSEGFKFHAMNCGVSPGEPR